ncbi:hypothetical protein CHS0354_037918 [Potamilus streckersoni]|uniref:C2 domain-containing protein n=1 Tax=Potamilus streckersoni TaxID=2493646 RepID=A0AAE0WAA8_9BIVA|nr:hypothetical protein CHS0354_037918 [Potamilus streckersoni]
MSTVKGGFLPNMTVTSGPDHHVYCEGRFLPNMTVTSGPDHHVYCEGRFPSKYDCTSDPYVKFSIGKRQYYRSRTILKNLNPKWDEKFTIPIDDPLQQVQVRAFDYDRGMTDDPMGSAEIDLTSLELNISTDLKLPLTDKKCPDEYMGYLKLQVRLLPKSQEEKENYYKKSVRMPQSESASKKVKMQIWSGVVTIVLLEGHDLIPMDDNGLSDPYVRFRLGNEKYKSKFKSKTLNPKWLEQFDLRMYEGQTSHLEITLYDHDVGRDDFMGRAEIDLSKLEFEKTHMIEQPLEDSAGFIKLLLTVSGTTGSETISDLQNFCFTPQQRNQIIRKYGLTKMFHNLKDVGWLQVKVPQSPMSYRASTPMLQIPVS